MQCRDGLRREKRNQQQQQQREREGRERRDVAAAARQTRFVVFAGRLWREVKIATTVCRGVCACACALV